MPVGTLTGPQQNVTLQAPAQLDKAEDYKRSWWPGGTACRSSSKKSRRVIDSVENNKVASWFNGERSIVLAIQRQPDANTVAVVDSIKDKLPALRARHPGLDFSSKC